MTDAQMIAQLNAIHRVNQDVLRMLKSDATLTSWPADLRAELIAMLDKIESEPIRPPDLRLIRGGKA